MPLLLAGDGGFEGSSASKLNFCSSPTKKRKISALASDSPGQVRLPTENGIRSSLLRTASLSPRNLLGSNSAPF